MEGTDEWGSDLGALLHNMQPELDIEDEFRKLETRMGSNTPAKFSPSPTLTRGTAASLGPAGGHRGEPPKAIELDDLRVGFIDPDPFQNATLPADFSSSVLGELPGRASERGAHEREQVGGLFPQSDSKEYHLMKNEGYQHIEKEDNEVQQPIRRRLHPESPKAAGREEWADANEDFSLLTTPAFSVSPASKASPVSPGSKIPVISTSPGGTLPQMHFRDAGHVEPRNKDSSTSETGSGGQGNVSPGVSVSSTVQPYPIDAAPPHRSTQVSSSPCEVPSAEPATQEKKLTSKWWWDSSPESKKHASASPESKTHASASSESERHAITDQEAESSEVLDLAMVELTETKLQLALCREELHKTTGELLGRRDELVQAQKELQLGAGRSVDWCPITVDELHKSEVEMEMERQEKARGDAEEEMEELKKVMREREATLQDETAERQTAEDALMLCEQELAREKEATWALQQGVQGLEECLRSQEEAMKSLEEYIEVEKVAKQAVQRELTAAKEAILSLERDLEDTKQALRDALERGEEGAGSELQAEREMVLLVRQELRQEKAAHEHCQETLRGLTDIMRVKEKTIEEENAAREKARAASQKFQDAFDALKQELAVEIAAKEEAKVSSRRYEELLQGFKEELEVQTVARDTDLRTLQSLQQELDREEKTRKAAEEAAATLKKERKALRKEMKALKGELQALVEKWGEMERGQGELTRTCQEKLATTEEQLRLVQGALNTSEKELVEAKAAMVAAENAARLDNIEVEAAARRHSEDIEVARRDRGAWQSALERSEEAEEKALREARLAQEALKRCEGELLDEKRFKERMEGKAAQLEKEIQLLGAGFQQDQDETVARLKEEAQSTAAKLKEELDALQARLESQSSSLVGLEGLVESERERGHSLEAALSEAHFNLKVSDMALQETLERLQALEAALEREKEKGNESAAHLNEALSYAEEVARIHEALESEKLAKDVAHQQLCVLQGEVDSVRAKLEASQLQLQSEVGTLRIALSSAEKEHAEMHKLHEQSNNEFMRLTNEIQRMEAARVSVDGEINSLVAKLTRERDESADERKRSLTALLALESLCEDQRREGEAAVQALEASIASLVADNDHLKRMNQELTEDVSSLQRIKEIYQSQSHINLTALPPPVPLHRPRPTLPAPGSNARFRLMVHKGDAAPPPIEGVQSDIAAAVGLEPSQVSVNRVGGWYAAVDCTIGEGGHGLEVGALLSSLVAQLGDSSSPLMTGAHTGSVSSFELLPPVSDDADEQYGVEVSMGKLLEEDGPRSVGRMAVMAEELASKTRLLLAAEERCEGLETDISQLKMLQVEGQQAVKLLQAALKAAYGGSPPPSHERAISTAGRQLHYPMQSSPEGSLYGLELSPLTKYGQKTPQSPFTPTASGASGGSMIADYAIDHASPKLSPRKGGILQFSPKGAAAQGSSTIKMGSGGAFFPTVPKGAASLAECQRALAVAESSLTLALERAEGAEYAFAEALERAQELQQALETCQRSLVAKMGGGAKVAIARVLRVERDRALLCLQLWWAVAHGPLGGGAEALVAKEERRRDGRVSRECLGEWCNAVQWCKKARRSSELGQGWRARRVVGAWRRMVATERMLGGRCLALADRIAELGGRRVMEQWLRVGRARRRNREVVERRKWMAKRLGEVEAFTAWRVHARDALLRSRGGEMTLELVCSSGRDAGWCFFKWAMHTHREVTRSRGVLHAQARRARRRTVGALLEWRGYARSAYLRVLRIMTMMGSRERLRARQAVVWWAAVARGAQERGRELLGVYARGRRRDLGVRDCVHDGFAVWRESTASWKRSERLRKTSNAVACSRSLWGWRVLARRQTQLGWCAAKIVKSRVMICMGEVFGAWRGRARRTNILATVAVDMVKTWISGLVMRSFGQWAMVLVLSEWKMGGPEALAVTLRMRLLVGRVMWGWVGYVMGKERRRRARHRSREDSARGNVVHHVRAGDGLEDRGLMGVGFDDGSSEVQRRRDGMRLEEGLALVQEYRGKIAMRQVFDGWKGRDEDDGIWQDCPENGI